MAAPPDAATLQAIEATAYDYMDGQLEGDVARVTLGPDLRQSTLRADGETGIGIGVIRQARSNSLEISRTIAAAVDTLGGDPVKLRVAPGTPSGRVLRVKGRGVQSSKGTGDLLAEVQVAVPAHLDDKAKEALERFHDLEPKENPRADLMAKARE